MEDKIINKFIGKIKDKLSKNKTTYPSVNEYAFSTEEIESISEQNKQKIQELKQDTFLKKKKNVQKKTKLEEETISPVEGKTVIDAGIAKETLEEQQTELKKEESPEEVKEKTLNQKSKEKIKIEDNQIESKTSESKAKPKNSFVNLSEEYQKIVMTKWNELDYKLLDKDIMTGKDLLNHNYTITYADDSAKFIYDIRKRYEVVICYLIGFNNEKKGIFEKTIFSDKMENEWKHLSNYIKVLEKIRSFRK